MKRRVVAELLQIAGIAALAVAGFMVAVALGWACVGIGLLVYGLATERDTSSADVAESSTV